MTAGRRGDLLVGLGLTAVVLAFFWRWLAAPTHTLYSPWSDVVVQFSGWKSFMARAWADGHGIAFWNPTYFCGTPAYANPQYLWAHPLHVLFHILPVDQAVAPTFALYLLLIGTGTHVWLRLCGLDTVSAGVGALAGVMAPRLLYHVAGGFLPYLLGVTCLPWAFAAVEYACRRATAWRWGLVAVVLALMVSSGFVQIWLYAGYTLALYVVLRPRGGWQAGGTADPGAAGAGGLLTGVIAAFIASLVLAAYHFWPAYVFAQYTTRGGALPLHRVADVSITGWHWLTAVLPQPWGDPSRMLATSDGRWLLWEQNVSFGLVPLLLLGVGRRGPHRRLWIGLAVLLGLCLAFAWGAGDPLFSLFYRLPGVARFRFPVRILFVAGVLLSGLTATAVARWLPPPEGAPLLPRARGFLVAALAFTGLGAALLTQAQNLRMVVEAPRNLGWAVGAALALAGLAAGMRFTKGTPWAAAVVAVCLVVDSARSAGWAVQMEDPAVVYPLNGPIRELQQRAGVDRVVDFSGAVHKGMPGRTGLCIPDGYDPLQLAHTVRYMRVLTGNAHQGEGNDIRLQPVAHPHLLELLGAPYVVTRDAAGDLAASHTVFHGVETFQFWRGVGVIPDSVYLFRNARAFPRAFVLGPARYVALADEARELAAFDPRQEILLGTAPPVEGSANFVAAHITAYTPNRITIAAASDGPGYLVLTDAWYPAWQATRNGEPAPVLRADGMFRAVPLPGAGEWTVELRYMPTAERQGALVTAGGVIAFALVGIRAARRRR